MAGSYTVTLTVTDQAGCSSAFVFTGQTASCKGSAGASVTHTLTVPPVLSFIVDRITSLKMSPSTIVAAARGPSVVAAATKRRKPGAVVSYVGTQPATTTFTVQRPAAGRVRGRSCVKPTRHNLRHRRCTRWLSVGSFSHADVVGLNRFRFTGRIRGRKLKAGRYRLRAIPHGIAGAGPAVFTRFRVKL